MMLTKNMNTIRKQSKSISTLAAGAAGGKKKSTAVSMKRRVSSAAPETFENLESAIHSFKLNPPAGTLGGASARSDGARSDGARSHSLERDQIFHLNNVNIIARASDGYIDLTALCQAGNKQYKHWFTNKKSEAFLKVLSSTVGIPTVELINKMAEGHGNNDRHTWGHPQVAINIAQWVSPEFDVQISKWVFELLTMGRVDLGKEISTKEIETKFHNQIRDLEVQHQLQIERKNDLIKSIEQAHQQFLKRKKRTPYECGDVLYLVSHPAFTYYYKDEYYKFGKASQKKGEKDSAFMRRLSTYNTGAPEDFDVNAIFYVKENVLIEDGIKVRFANCLNPSNKEWIKGEKLEDILMFIRSMCENLMVEYKEVKGCPRQEVSFVGGGAPGAAEAAAEEGEEMVKNRWTPEEENILRSAVRGFESSNVSIDWEKIASENMGGVRSAAACMLRWYKIKPKSAGEERDEKPPLQSSPTPTPTPTPTPSPDPLKPGWLEVRGEDGFVNLTKIYQYFGIMFKEYQNRSVGRQFMRTLTETVGVEIVKKGEKRVLWGMPALADHFLEWIARGAIPQTLRAEGRREEECRNEERAFKAYIARNDLQGAALRAIPK
jgi:hypothetical protein